MTYPPMNAEQIRAAIKRLERKYAQQGAMVPPPIRQVILDRINKLHDQLDALNAQGRQS